jgi:hypothetical protein
VTETKPDAPRRWWGTHAIPLGSSGYWQLGPLKLWVRRGEREWQIARQRGDDPLEDALAVQVPSELEASDEASFTRHALRKTGEDVSLLPALPDRSLVVRPVAPFYLPSGEETTLFVSSPLWVQMQVQRPPIPLEDEPIFRPSDTWFGPTTLAGELCYATTTGARLELEELPLRPHRAVSAVRIRNRARSELFLERLKLPTMNLSLFYSASGHLWTQALTLDREEDGEHASVQLENTPPANVGRTEIVAQPRQRVGKGFLLEAFGGLFARKKEKSDERDVGRSRSGGDPDP